MSVALDRRGASAATAANRPPKAQRRSWLARTWSREPEPQLRIGQTLLPGLTSLRDVGVEPGHPLLQAAADLSRGRHTYERLTLAVRRAEAWRPSGAPADWLAAHHRLHGMWPLVVAGTLAATPAVGRGWYQTATELVRTWLDTGAEADLDRTIAPRRIVAALAFLECFEAELRDDGEQRMRLLRALHREVARLSGAVGDLPADPWLVGAARALFLAGRAFDGPEANHWQEQGAEVLWAQLRSQVAEDGSHLRRSPSWQALVLEDYAHVLAVLAASGEAPPGWCRKPLKGMCDVLWRTTHGDGSLVALGERAPQIWWTSEELVATIATLLGESGLAPAEGDGGLLPRLLLGPHGRRAYAALPRRRPGVESRAMRRMGLFVLGGPDDDAMIVDAGAPRRREEPFGYELAIGGLPVVVSSWDAGAGGGLGDYVASPRSQNVLIDHRASMGAAGAMPGHPEASWTLRDGLVILAGSHGRHRRLVVCLPGRFWLVIDEMRGVGPWDGESLLHLHPETEVRVRANGRTVVDVARSPAARARIAYAGVREMRLIGGVAGPRPQGWLAGGDGPAQPAPTLALGVAGTLPVCAGYVVVPRSEQDVTLDLAHEPLRITAVVRIGRAAYHIDVIQDDVALHHEIV